MRKIHCMYPAWVTLGVFQELMETYFKKNAFRIQDSHALAGFLNDRDPWIFISAVPTAIPVDFISNLVVAIRDEVFKHSSASPL